MKKDKPKYCEYCGKKNIIVESWAYDPDTGKRIMFQRCEDMCEQKDFCMSTYPGNSYRDGKCVICHEPKPKTLFSHLFGKL